MFFERWNDNEKQKKTFEKKGRRTGGTAKWDRLGQVRVRGTGGTGIGGIRIGWDRMGQGQQGLHIGWDRMGLRQGGLQIRWDKMGLEQGGLPAEPVHLSQSG